MEMTRLCVDDSLPKAMRRRVKRMLICALLEFGLANDIRRMIGVMPPKLWESVFGDVGCRIEFVGKVRIVGGGSARAGLLEITVAHLREARRASNILRAVLEGGLPCVDDYRLKAGRILLRLKVA
jgi:N-acyl-L-homoserine lactone synthetase